MTENTMQKSGNTEQIGGSGALHYPLEEKTFLEDSIMNMDGPLQVEVGCGNGHFLCDMAARFPDTRFTGIDIRRKRIEKSCRKVSVQKLENIRFILGDAKSFFSKVLPAASLDTVYVTFPDPWPKYRHRKHRLNTPEFLESIARVLKPGGRLCWICDYYPQILDIITLAKDLPFRNVNGPAGFSREMPDLPPTLYEQKWREEARSIFYVLCERL